MTKSDKKEILLFYGSLSKRTCIMFNVINNIAKVNGEMLDVFQINCTDKTTTLMDDLRGRWREGC